MWRRGPCRAPSARRLKPREFAPRTCGFVIPHQAGTGIVRFTGMKLEGCGIRGELINGPDAACRKRQLLLDSIRPEKDLAAALTEPSPAQPPPSAAPAPAKSHKAASCCGRRRCTSGKDKLRPSPAGGVSSRNPALFEQLRHTDTETGQIGFRG